MFAFGGSATVTAGHMKFSRKFTLKTYHFLFEWQPKKEKKKITKYPSSAREQAGGGGGGISKSLKTKAA